MENKTFKSKIESLSFEGLGVCKFEDKVYFVADSWPGDEALIEVTKEKKTYGFGKIKELIAPSHERMSLSPCDYHNNNFCDGCPWMRINYSAQLREKKNILTSLIKKFRLETTFQEVPDIIKSPELSYKNRLQLHNDRKKVGFMRKKSKEISSVKKCVIANDKINELIKYSHENKRSLSKKIYLDDRMTQNDVLKGRNLGFRQGNEFINQEIKKFITESINETNNQSALELFCGQGNFTRELKKSFTNYFAIDSVTGSLKSNPAENLTVKTQNIYKQLPINVSFEKTSFLLLDPPRSGFADLNQVVKNLPNLKDIIYISCNPSSAVSDIQKVQELGLFDIINVQGFDAYPHTAHLEVGIHLKIK